MKLKRLATDFEVEEQISLRLGSGPFALYRLTKQSLGTLEALQAIEDKWNLPRQRVAFAGLKDRHATTSQYITIRGGSSRGFSQTNLGLEYVGQVERPIHASDINGNRFRIVVRDLSKIESQSTQSRIEELSRDGLPNYFDNQRFGSVGESGEFIAKPWCLGNYERALWLALADPNVHDRVVDRDEKAMLRNQWGNWQLCSERIDPSVRQDVVKQLARQPGDFRRALAAFPHSLRSLWLAAFQSHLWNQVLARLVVQEVGNEQTEMHQIGSAHLPFFGRLNDSQRGRLQNTLLPLPSARLHLENDDLRPLYDQLLEAEGIELRQVRVKYPRDTFFSKGERKAVFQPSELTHSIEADDLYSGCEKLTLAFTLPRGCYATILIKRLFGNDEGMADEGDGGIE